jgi:lysozyme
MILAMFCAVAAHSQPASFHGTCPKGPMVTEAKYCNFFVHYNPGDAVLPEGVGDLLHLSKPAETRSIGLIIEIDSYPNMPGHDLAAAKKDGDNLRNFLVNEQHFDEVIVLRNADATEENINYFLRTYLVTHGDEYQGGDAKPRARLLIAYSGHGRSKTPTTEAAFILGAAADPNGSSSIYDMRDFASRVVDLAPHYYHVLTLINACYGGNVFAKAMTGAADTPDGPGSYVITAGPPTNEVMALIPDRGSLFFDLIINAIRQGEADPDAYEDILSTYVTTGDSLHKSTGSLTESFTLPGYLARKYRVIKQAQRKANPSFDISDPYGGPLQKGPEMAKGFFFFVSSRPADTRVASITPYLTPLALGATVETASIRSTGAEHGSQEAAGAPVPGTPASASAGDASTNLPLGPISSIKGHPDIKIFKPPTVYPIKGFDLSSADGKVNWNLFSKAPRPSFIYVRALGWAGPDSAFSSNWSQVKALGVDRGAYLKFNFCLPVQDQVDQLRSLMGTDRDALPAGIELVTPDNDQPQGDKQKACYDKIGVSERRERILQLAQGIKTLSGKVPLLMGNSANLSALTDARSEPYMIWLDAYGSPGSIAEKLKLHGRNPWTLWQYSGTLTMAGIGGKKTTGEVFFGTPAQYEAFRRGDTNVARAAVQ